MKYTFLPLTIIALLSCPIWIHTQPEEKKHSLIRRMSQQLLPKTKSHKKKLDDNTYKKINALIQLFNEYSENHKKKPLKLSQQINLLILDNNINVLKQLHTALIEKSNDNAQIKKCRKTINQLDKKKYADLQQYFRRQANKKSTKNNLH